MLHKRLNGLPIKLLFNMIVKVTGSSLVMGAMGYGALQVSNLIVNTHTFIGLLTQTMITVIVSVLTYLVITRKLKLPEVKMVLKPISLFIKKN